MEIAIVVIVVVLLFGAVVLVGSALAGGWRDVETERIAFFTMEPGRVCPSPSCAVDLRYEITTTHDNTQATLTMIGPTGATSELSSDLAFSFATNGADSTFWTDGPGEYLFVLQVTGDQIGSRSQTRRSILLSSAGGIIGHSARVDMQDAEDLNVARDSFRITENRNAKIPEYTICSKVAEITRIAYIQGGLSGHNRNLNITIRRGDGTILLDLLSMEPGSEVPVRPAVLISEGVQIDGTMVGGFAGTPPNSIATPFSPIDIVGWDLEIKVQCI